MNHNNPYDSLLQLEELGLPISVTQRLEAEEKEIDFFNNELVPEITAHLNNVLKNFHQPLQFKVKYDPIFGIEIENTQNCKKDSDYFIMRKLVDKSVLYQGFTIPVKFHDIFYQQLGHILGHGEKEMITILFDNQIHQCPIMNIDFDKDIYCNHKDLLQLRWSEYDTICQHIQTVFQESKKLIDDTLST